MSQQGIVELSNSESSEAFFDPLTLDDIVDKQTTFENSPGISGQRPDRRTISRDNSAVRKSVKAHTSRRNSVEEHFRRQRNEIQERRIMEKIGGGGAREEEEVVEGGATDGGVGDDGGEWSKAGAKKETRLLSNVD